MLPRLLAVCLVAAAGSQDAAAQTAERWSLDCQQTAAGRECALTVPLPIRVKQRSEKPVIATWTMVNRAIGIDETLAVHIDSQLMPSHRLVGISEQERRTITAPRPPSGDIPGPAVREALVAGKDLTVLLIDDHTGKQTMAKLPVSGFEAARAALLVEVSKGANRK